MEKRRVCETAQFSSRLLLACGVGEVLKLAGIQLVSSGCSAGWAGRASRLSFTALAPVWLPLTAAAAAAPLPPGPRPAGLVSLPVPAAQEGLVSVPEVVGEEGALGPGQAGEGGL